MHRSTPATGPTVVQSHPAQELPHSGAKRYRVRGDSERAPGITPALAPKGANHNPERGSRMHPTPDPAAGPTAVKQFPPAGREEMCDQWGLSPSAHWTDTDEQDTAALAERGFLADGGWSVATVIEGGGRSGGMTSHRGVLHPAEYVNDDLLIAMIEQELGFTYEQIRSVYSPGRPTQETREMRGQIDARLLALSRSGTNMLELGRRLGFGIDEDRRVCEVFERAIARAREADKAAA